MAEADQEKSIWASGGSAVFIGVLFLLLGINIFFTGELRSVIVLGESKYIVAGASATFGLWSVFVGARALLNRRCGE